MNTFVVLAEPKRREILDALRAEPQTVSALVDALGVSQPAVSKHLRVLRSSGYVDRRKEGLYAFYTIADPSVEVLCEIMCGRLEEQAEEQSAMLAGG